MRQRTFNWVLGLWLFATVSMWLYSAIEGTSSSYYQETLTKTMEEMNQQLGRKETQTILNNLAQVANDSNNVDKKTVGLVSYCSGPRYELLQTLVTYNRKAYADMWNYTIFSGSSDEMPMEPFVTPKPWLKAAYLYQLLKDARNDHVEWFLWLDCDALIAKLDWNVTHVLSSVLENVDTSRHFAIVSQDPNAAFNSGVMFLQNNDWVRDLFQRTLQMAFNETIRNDPWWEQRALLELHAQNHFGEQDHFYVSPHRSKINAMRSFRRNDYVEDKSFVWHRINCRKQQICDDRALTFFCEHMPNQSYPEQQCANITPGATW